MDGTTVVRGIDCELHMVAAANTSLSDSTEIDCVRGVDTTNVWTEADATTRQSQTQMSEPILDQMSISFEVVVVPDDTMYKALVAAALAKTKKYFHCYSGARATAGIQYVKGFFKVFDYSSGQPLDGLETRKFTIKPCFQASADFIRGINT